MLNVPLALYVHFPWCVRKCPYCDFNSHELRSGEPFLAWRDATLADLDAALPQIAGRPVQSVFIGGGTPSLLPSNILATLLDAFFARLPFAPEAEITLEANPGTAEADRFRAYAAAGVNRLSLGIQSFDDDQLRRIGRIHHGNEARRALDVALAHFDRVNADLMFAQPGQSVDQALSDLDIALNYGLQHLSCYHFTLEPNTPFAQNPPPLPDEDLTADMEEMLLSRLADFDRYEVSAFARAGQQCRHNLNYWHFGDYLGIGPGAHGKLTTEAIVREQRHKHPTRYLKGAACGDFVQERHQVEAAQLPLEFMMNALRLTDGVPTSLFTERTGLPLESIAAAMEQARRADLLDRDPDRLRPTAHGLRFLNDLLQLFA